MYYIINNFTTPLGPPTNNFVPTPMLRPSIRSNTSGRTKHKDLPYPAGRVEIQVINAHIASRCEGLSFKTDYFSGTVNSSFQFYLRKQRTVLLVNNCILTPFLAFQPWPVLRYSYSPDPSFPSPLPFRMQRNQSDGKAWPAISSPATHAHESLLIICTCRVKFTHSCWNANAILQRIQTRSTAFGEKDRPILKSPAAHQSLGYE